MNQENNSRTFIPCGDSMERIQEIRDDELENVSGGAGYSPDSKMCPNCGGRMIAQRIMQNGAYVLDHYYCSTCKYEGR